MEDLTPNKDEGFANTNDDFLVDEHIIKKLEMNQQKINIEPKKLHVLENNLISALIAPTDSDIRKRYIKKWIYGDGIKTKIKENS